MDNRDYVLRSGTAAVLCAVLFRIFSMPQTAAFLAKPQTISAILYMETGQILRFPAQEAAGRESPPPEPTEKQHPAPDFLGEDAVSVSNTSGLQNIDFTALLQSPLRWSLRGDSPRVLIYHTHTSESYEPEEPCIETSPYHTLDPRFNMVAVGQVLKETLEAGGIKVIHDTTVYDTDYSRAYDASLAGVEKIMEENPGILLLIDLHRDAAEENGQQVFSVSEVDGEASARLMAVCGSVGGGYDHPYWEENLAIALKLQALLGRIGDDLCRPVSLSPSRFNQQYFPGSLLIEVGTAGNTLQQAKVAARLLGQAILELAEGTANP